MAKKQEVAVKENTLPSVDLFEQEAGAGLEGLTPQDYAIPFLVVLQQNSPQLNKTEASYIKGATGGQIFNTVSGKLYDEVTVVPCAFAHKVVEWRPRGSGGGLVAQYDREDQPEDVTANEKGQMQRANGNLLIPTAYHYVLIIDPDLHDFEQAVIAMSSTQLKKSKKWNSLMGALKLEGKNGPFTPPIYSHRYMLSTAGESNDKGNWFGWLVQGGTLIENKELIEKARAFSKNARNISLKPAAPSEEI